MKVLMAMNSAFPEASAVPIRGRFDKGFRDCLPLLKDWFSRRQKIKLGWR